MNFKFKILSFLFLVSNLLYSQDNQEIALQKGREAIQLMDEGKIDESILLLEESQKLDPENINYPYEIAYANYLKQDYEKAIEMAEKLENHKNVDAQLYALWGNSYDLIGKPEKAIEIYDLGLKRFPESGSLYLEKGVVYELQNDLQKAVDTYQKGISVQSNYPSNYYRLANIYLNSEDKTPGLVYGEIFINLERTTERTKEISKKLFETYKNAVIFENNEWKELNFCKEIIVDAEKFEKDKKLPFCMIFGSQFSLGLINSNPEEINLKSLAEIRKDFINSYVEKAQKDYPNILFEYQKTMMDNGVFDAYNHYIFQMGAKFEFSEWLKNNEKEYNDFVDWYTKPENIINPTRDNYWVFNF